MELSEILAAIGTFVGGDKAKAKEVAEALRGDTSTKPVAQELINVGNAGKTAELQPRLKALEKERDEVVAARDALQVELDEVKAKTPDAKTIEEKAKAKYEPQIAKLTKERDDAIGGQKALRKQVAKEKFTSLLKRADEQGVKVEDDWADRVVASEFDDRFVERDDGSLDVLQVGETTAYDGKTLDEKIASLAADVRKKVNPKYLITSTDRGGGVGGGGTGGRGQGGEWSELRKKIEAERAAQGQTGPSAAERLRGVRQRTESDRSDKAGDRAGATAR